MKFDVIVADPPWMPKDKLTMSSVKRGAASQYKVLSTDDIKSLNVASIAKDNSVLALWVPSFLLKEGLEVMKSWGFNQKQTVIWVKTKKNPLEGLGKKIRSLKTRIKKGFYAVDIKDINSIISKFDSNTILQFFMGHLFRSCHEICLIGTKGSVYANMKDRSQRSVIFAPNTKHSAKPELLQDRLDLIFPKSKKLEIFARRDKNGWYCIGDECPSTLNEDIRTSIKKLKAKKG